jgi:hypothetical protein
MGMQKRLTQLHGAGVVPLSRAVRQAEEHVVEVRAAQRRLTTYLSRLEHERRQTAKTMTGCVDFESWEKKYVRVCVCARAPVCAC